MSSDQSLVTQLALEAMDLFNAGTTDRPGVCYGCLVTRAAPPTLRARLANGLTFQGGTSTGRGVRDTCESSLNLPETFFGTGAGATPLMQAQSCHVTEPVMLAVLLSLKVPVAVKD